MTRVEYDNTVRDLLGDTRRLAGDFPEDGRPVRGFANDANARCGLRRAWSTATCKAAEKLAAAAVANLPMLLAGATRRATASTCLDQFLDGFGKRAWRRPLTAREKAEPDRRLHRGAQGQGLRRGHRGGHEVMLMAPQFLYRYEQGVARRRHRPTRS